MSFVDHNGIKAISLNSTNVTVSVCMITYNHDRYIAKAIESVLMQQTDFRFELIIGEDCSTDNTRSIVTEYCKNYPDKIRLILNDNNLGIQVNFASTLSACTGKYIALCEGDDYWTDPFKLEKQVNLLENHPSYSGCFHKAQVDFENRSKTSHLSGGRSWLQETEFTLSEVVQPGLINTVTFMLRNHLITNFPDWYYQLAMGDYPLWVLLAQKGNIGFIDEVMAVYRVHDQGFWSGKNAALALNQSIFALEVIDRYLQFRYHDLIMQSVFSYWCKLIKFYTKENNMREARVFITKSVKNLQYKGRFPTIKYIKLLIGVYFPFFMPLLKQ